MDVDVFEPCIAKSCGVRSLYFIHTVGGHDYGMCGHHFNEYKEKVWETAVTVVDMAHTV